MSPVVRSWRQPFTARGFAPYSESVKVGRTEHAAPTTATVGPLRGNGRKESHTTPFPQPRGAIPGCGLTLPCSAGHRLPARLLQISCSPRFTLHWDPIHLLLTSAVILTTVKPETAKSRDQLHVDV